MLTKQSFKSVYYFDKAQAFEPANMAISLFEGKDHTAVYLRCTQEVIDRIVNYCT